MGVSGPSTWASTKPWWRRVIEATAEAARAVNVPLVARNEERREERQTLDMVPVHVRHQCNSIYRSALFNKLFTEITKACAEIQKKWSLAISLYRNTRSIATVFHSGWTMAWR